MNPRLCQPIWKETGQPGVEQARCHGWAGQWQQQGQQVLTVVALGTEGRQRGQGREAGRLRQG